MYDSLNVLGKKLSPCCTDPMTGFYRDGCCNTGDDDHGIHTVCIHVTDDFLKASKAVGNDLSTPMPEHGFKGLKANDRWCLCAGRWLELFKIGRAPHVYLDATHEETLAIIDFKTLQSFAL